MNEMNEVKLVAKNPLRNWRWWIAFFVAGAALMIRPVDLNEKNEWEFRPLELACVLVVAVMMSQQFKIADLARQASDLDAEKHLPWDERVQRYRRHLSIVVYRGLLAMLVVIILQALLASFLPWENYYRLLRESDSLRGGLIVALVLGLVRAVMDWWGEAGFARRSLAALFRAVPGRSENRLLWKEQQHTRDNGPMLWVVIFFAFWCSEPIVSKGLEKLFSHSFVEMTRAGQPQTSDIFVGFLISTTFLSGLWLTWFAWIYVGIYRALTESEHLTPGAARDFLASWSKPYRVLQAVVIGPVNQGKSHFCVVEHQTLGTVEVSGWSFFQDALAGRPPKPGDLPPGPDYRLTIIDTPGDFLGAQLRTVMRYRTDVLVLVVAADTLNPEKLNQDGEKILDLFKEAIVTPSSFSAKLIGARSSEETKSALGTGREYVASLVNALKMGRETKKDAGGNDRETIVTAQDLYAVKKFLLFINAPIGTRADLAGGLQKCANLQKIADELGGLFGCTGPKRVVIGDANTPLDGRDNLFLGWPSVPIPIANSVPPKKKSGIGTLGDSKTDGGTSHSAPPTPLVP